MKTWHIILVLVFCLLCFLAGRHTNRAGGVLVGKNDTLILYDTIRDSIPYPVYETVIQTVPEMFPIYITLDGDTVREPIVVPVPINQKEYLTENYHAWISGYNAALDSIDVFPKTVYVTKKIPDRRWGLGVIGGYGVNLVCLPILVLVFIIKFGRWLCRNQNNSVFNKESHVTFF